MGRAGGVGTTVEAERGFAAVLEAAHTSAVGSTVAALLESCEAVSLADIDTTRLLRIVRHSDGHTRRAPTAVQDAIELELLRRGADLDALEVIYGLRAPDAAQWQALKLTQLDLSKLMVDRHDDALAWYVHDHANRAGACAAGYAIACCYGKPGLSALSAEQLGLLADEAFDISQTVELALESALSSPPPDPWDDRELGLGAKLAREVSADLRLRATTPVYPDALPSPPPAPPLE